MRVFSCDVGKKNYAFYIEEFDEDALSSIENLPSKERYNPDATPTEAMDEILDQVCMNGRSILYKNNDLCEGCDPKLKLDPLTLHNLTDLLDSYKDEWDQCDAFIIEMQMSFRGVVNLPAIKIAQHTYSYFILRYGKDKVVLDYPAFHKTQVMGAPKTPKTLNNGKTRYYVMTKPQRKKWSIAKATELLEKRGEEDFVSKAKKKDDLADTVMQLQSYKYLRFVNETL